MKGFFITGTDTGIGKTVISAILTLALQGYYWKPVQTGSANEIVDQERVRELTGLSPAHFLSSSYCFHAALSPHQAAKHEGRSIDLEQCGLPESAGPLIVEGAGGVYVPLNAQQCMLDLMQQLDLPVIIICRGTLGTINHTLLTIDALRQRNLFIHGVIFNGELLTENRDTIEQWGKVKTLLHIPQLNLTRELFRAWIFAQQTEVLAALR